MWTETKHGLYKRFTFPDFPRAWGFMEQASKIIGEMDRHPRWQNENNVVEIWLSSADESRTVTTKDKELASALDALARALLEERVETVDDKNTTQITELQLYADGGSRGNPGPSASGFVLMDMEGKVLYRKGVFLGITTNNQAEYQALKLGLEAALGEFRTSSVHVYMDSLLVINQMKNIFKVRNRDLWPVHDAILETIKKFSTISFDHVPRELNKLADAEVNKCLDAEQDASAQHVN